MLQEFFTALTEINACADLAGDLLAERNSVPLRQYIVGEKEI